MQNLTKMPIINKDLSPEEANTRVTTKLTIIDLPDLLEGASTDRKYMVCCALNTKKCNKIAH